MKKYMILSLICLLTLSCTNYEKEFQALEERIEKLKAADQRTREMIIAEMDMLSQDIVKRIAQMEKNVHDYLDASMERVRGRIDDESDKLHARIESKSAELGVSIKDYSSKIDQLIRSRQKDFEKTRSNLEKELDQSIKNGNAALTRRIRNGLDNLATLQETLPVLVNRTQARMDALTGLDEKYRKVSAEVEKMGTRMNAMIRMSKDYQDELIDLIASDLNQYASTRLQEYYMNVTQAYDTAESIQSEIENMTGDLESVYSDIPDLDSVLGEAESLFGELEDLETYLSGYDPEGEASDLLSTLEEALDLSKNISFDIGELESASDAAIDKMEACDDAIMESLSFFEDRMDMMAAILDDMVSMVS